MFVSNVVRRDLTKKKSAPLLEDVQESQCACELTKEDINNMQGNPRRLYSERALNRHGCKVLIPKGPSEEEAKDNLNGPIADHTELATREVHWLTPIKQYPFLSAWYHHGVIGLRLSRAHLSHKLRTATLFLNMSDIYCDT